MEHFSSVTISPTGRKAWVRTTDGRTHTYDIPEGADPADALTASADRIAAWIKRDRVRARMARRAALALAGTEEA